MKKVFLCITIMLISFAAAAQNEGASTWIVEADEINPSEYYGLSVANGMIGLVSSAEPLNMAETVLNGVYDYYGRGRVSNILNGFNFAGVWLDIDGERINRDNITDYTQRLHMKAACFTSEFEIPGKAAVTYRVRSLRQLPFTALIDIQIIPKSNIEITASSRIEAPDILRDVRNFYSEIDRPHVNIPLLTSVGESPTGKHKVAASSSFIFPDEHAPDVIHEDWDHTMHLAKFKKKLKKGESYRFSIVASETSTEHFADPHNEAERLTVYAALQGREKLIEDHEREWERLWKSDIKITGNDDDQRDVRFALYHLYSFARAGTAYSLSPMGLSGLGYNGHVFWDTELWMYPPLLMLQPQIAKSLIEYRYRRLDEARQKAFAHGFDGAMYPWESDDEGQEATPVWALTGPFEHHITAVVGIAAWNYYRVTKDEEWLRQKGFPMMQEIADYWVSRVEQDEEGNYNINNVVGADEWAENVDNNAFTNGAAITVLQYAASAARALGEVPDPRWEKVAEAIPVLTFQDGVTREHASYQGEDIKQADVNLLAYPLNVVNEERSIRKNLEYYEPRIGKGPAMSYSVFSVLYARLGNAAKAYELFHKSYRPNEVPPFGVLAEAAGGTNPYFATGAGGMLQAVLSGFGGLEITDEGITQLKAAIPEQWKELHITGVGIEEKNFSKAQ